MPVDSVSAVRLEVANQRLLVCERLPTPIPSLQASGALLSPPLSRAPSPPPASFNPGTPPSSQPSPLLPVSSADHEPRQLGQKTSAFFSSPFDRHNSILSPPPAIQSKGTLSITNSPSSSSSLGEPAVTDPECLQTNGGTFYSNSPVNGGTPSNTTPSVHSNIVSPISPDISLPSPSPSQSINTATFFAKGFATLTPPNSAHSCFTADEESFSLEPPLLSPWGAILDRDLNLSDEPGKLECSSLADQPYFSRDSMTADDLQSLSSNPTDLDTSDALTPKSEVPLATTSQPLHRETVSLDSIKLAKDSIIGTDVPLRLVRELGQGAFSCVWLALDVEHKLEKSPVTSRLRSMSMARKKSDKAVHGLRPPIHPSTGGNSLSRSGSVYLAAQDGEGATIASEQGELFENASGGRLFAVKMIGRAACEDNDRMRISFVREVEVLRHISHPSIVSYIHSFTTPTHHCLVLEALQGGELFDLLNQGDNHSRMTEPLVRRIFGELCQAVGWMHGVGLVHRDLKLENILFVTNPFLTPASSSIDLTSLPSPLIKLSDFGLARFIDPDDSTLVTRCGSESYAAPEIVTGMKYDGRQTDAWACGIVLYALATCSLPFDRTQNGDRDTRRSHLMRIAQGKYAWPEPEARLATEGLKDVVTRLLVRDPTKRARVVDLWDEPWMRGEGAPTPPLSKTGSTSSGHLVGKDIPSVAKQEL